MDVIVAYDLCKRYGDITALSGLNLQIPEGQVFGCVGREKSGKTTLIRLLSGLCRPTSGECSILGMSPFFESEKLHGAVGTVLSTSKLYENLTVTENLSFFAGINGVDENDAMDRMSFLLHRLDIWEERDDRPDELSTGVLFRASLARALMHRPRVLLIDEPAGGLNRETSQSVQEILAHLTEQEGVTVLLCAANFDYAQQTCHSFALLKDGVMLARGDREALRQGAGVRYRARLRLGGEDEPPRGFRFADGFWEKEISSEEEMSRIIAREAAEGKKLYEARVAEPTLEDIYNAFLEGGKRRAGATEDEQDDYYDDRDRRAAPETYSGEPAAPADGDAPSAQNVLGEEADQ